MRLADVLWSCLIGLAAGWLSGQIMKTKERGVFTNLIIGVIGAIIGGAVFQLAGFTTTNPVGQLISATVGAILLIVVLRKLGSK